MCRKFITGLLLLVSLGMLSACRSLDDIQFKGIESVIFQGFENSTVRFSAQLHVSNPSGIGFKIKDVNLKTVANGDYLGTLHCDDVVKIASRADSVYSVPMSLKLGNLVTGAASLYKISRQRNVKMEVKGYVRVTTMFFSRTIEVSEARVLDVPKIR